ncbi:hypothetical protein BKA70DRAFT_1369523 [Coprinopsis sp. MPI-PUGE-AT-0042]|nr:hypothetical protein BKA70DRAFT_1369523 [Coprinopsis sp. MPI-PUGE-AT-0042]
MAMKRKLDLDVEHDDLGPLKQKQLKLVPFPNYQHEDSEMMDVEPLRPEQHHLRLPSDASAYSSASTSPLTTSLPLYHSYDAQPSPFFNPETGAVDHNSHSYAHYSAQSSPSQSAVGLMQPSANGFVHHG